MAIRQNVAPMNYPMSARHDEGALWSSVRAGKVYPIMSIPVYRGERGSGQIDVSALLAHMPRPVRNRVRAVVQAWFLPKSADARFSGYNEFLASYRKEKIKAAGAVDRDPPSLFVYADPTDHATAFGHALASDVYKTLGLHHPEDKPLNVELWNVYRQIYNFRLAANSDRLTQLEYWDPTKTTADYWSSQRAFWGQTAFSHVVPDYETALVEGQLSLDISAGSIPVTGVGFLNPHVAGSTPLTKTITETGNVDRTGPYYTHGAGGEGNRQLFFRARGLAASGARHIPAIWADMTNTKVITSLNDIDVARRTQAMAQARASYAGINATGKQNENLIIAELMAGFRVPDEVLQRPWLLNAKVIDFSMVERFSTDSADLDMSSTRGMGATSMFVNLPPQDVGGTIMVTLELVPERIYERMADIQTTLTQEELPDTVRDLLRTHPVDQVQNWRVDAKHDDLNLLYGYEPMNARFRRKMIKLGGDFYQNDPDDPWTEQRSALWMPNIKDPSFDSHHYLVPDPFPHDIFSDTLASAAEIQVNHSIAFVTPIVFGDELTENRGDFEALSPEAEQGDE